MCSFDAITGAVQKTNRRYGRPPYAAVCLLESGGNQLMCLHGGLRLCRHVHIVVSCKNRVIFHTGSASRGRGMSRSMPSWSAGQG